MLPDRDPLPHRQLVFLPTEVAVLVGRSAATIRRMIAAGILKAKHVRGRYYVSRDEIQRVFGCWVFSQQHPDDDETLDVIDLRFQPTDEGNETDNGDPKASESGG